MTSTSWPASASTRLAEPVRNAISRDQCQRKDAGGVVVQEFKLHLE